MSAHSLFSGKLDLTGWERYGEKEHCTYSGVAIPGLRQEAYQKTIDGELISVGVFYYNNLLAYMAWGLKSAHHCGTHAALSSEGIVGETRIGCPEIATTYGSHGEVTGFILDDKERFGSGTVSSVGKWRRLLPLLGLLGLVIVWATYSNWPLTSISDLVHGWMLDFMAAFFLLFGGLKVINIKGFAEMYKKYDIIAKRFPVWGYVYAVLEVVLGILYFTRTELFLASVVTAVVMTIATIGVYQKLQKKEETSCACLGGFFKVPITWLTFVENVVMILMALMYIMK